MTVSKQKCPNPSKAGKAYPVRLIDDARKELFALNAVNRAAFVSTLDDFEQYSPSHPMVDTEKIEGDLFELKTESSSHWLRGFYFHFKDGLYVVTHLFAKKTNKTPKANRELGTVRYKAFREAMKEQAPQMEQQNR